MYFIKGGGSVYHILDLRNGGAPAPCGAKLDRIDLFMLRAGESRPNVVREMPDAAPLCKHCMKAREDEF